MANWSAAFREVNDGFNAIAQRISETGGVLDVFTAWGSQLQSQFVNNPKLTFWDMVTGDLSGSIIILLVIVAFVLYILSVVIFSFFYAMYGAVLYVCGPPIIALLPAAGARELGKSFAVNLMIWNTWAVLYAVFGLLITAIHMDHVDQILGNGFMGWMSGLADGPMLGLVSIVYALTIALIPLIAKRIVSGDVGSTVGSLLGAAAAVVGVATAGISGVSAGATTTSSSGAGSGASSAGAASAGKGGAAAAATGTTSSSAPPTRALTVGEALNASRSGVQPSASMLNAGSSTKQSQAGEEGSAAKQTKRSSGFAHGFYRPVGVMQSISFSVGKTIGKAVGGTKEASDDKAEA